MYQAFSSSGGGRGSSELSHQGEFLEDEISVELTSSQQLEPGCSSGGLINACQAKWGEARVCLCTERPESIDLKQQSRTCFTSHKTHLWTTPLLLTVRVSKMKKNNNMQLR